MANLTEELHMFVTMKEGVNKELNAPAAERAVPSPDPHRHLL
jgi:hypothetical protein